MYKSLPLSLYTYTYIYIYIYIHTYICIHTCIYIINNIFRSRNLDSKIGLAAGGCAWGHSRLSLVLFLGFSGSVLG